MNSPGGAGTVHGSYSAGTNVPNNPGHLSRAGCPWLGDPEGNYLQQYR